MSKCTRCSEYGYRFDRTYTPEDYVEGDPASPVWVIGLNPAMEIGFNDTSSLAHLRSHLRDMKHEVAYFRDFRGVSRKLFDDLGEVGGAAHTDIVKCYSKRFPAGKAGSKLVANCQEHLRLQIHTHRPKLLVCNGAQVSDYIQRILPRTDDPSNTDTSYWHSENDYEVCVVLSGFLGRIDRFARLRLGREIEARRAECEQRTNLHREAA